MPPTYAGNAMELIPSPKWSHPQDINDPSKLQAWNNFSEVALVLDLVLSIEPLALVGFHVVLSLHS